MSPSPRLAFAGWIERPRARLKPCLLQDICSQTLARLAWRRLLASWRIVGRPLPPYRELPWNEGTTSDGAKRKDTHSGCLLRLASGNENGACRLFRHHGLPAGRGGPHQSRGRDGAHAGSRSRGSCRDQLEDAAGPAFGDDVGCRRPRRFRSGRAGDAGAAISSTRRA